MSIGLIVLYIFSALFIGLGLLILGWFIKNKPKGAVDTAAELFTTPAGLMTAKGRMICVLTGLSFLGFGGLGLWIAIT